ncbi:FAD binding domain-containing protein [Novosphingobium flavum]|uniref:FAD binding domain-containing protein n=1 Tax=Novosphingobium aerophilum TaxID=2839843 RepID=A0A7X1FA85_9SPHN|nr:FAD binding domain-containing protein [Novosphingobium aerophilum]MBC2653265.1 FAD binding domain-containing protein [Novosphingobium aerophilum]MBC2663180.1 FAD binding domain-containing protein [Novosphingobium aerophilum]
MKPAPFDYVAPRTVAEACAVLSEAGGGATVIAGGQTLMPLLNLRMSQPFILVDVNHIEGFSGVTRVPGGTRIAPATRQAAALKDGTLAAHVPALVSALGHVGHHQTRNRGTIGGSVALGEPAAEMPATAVALGAAIDVASVRGTRTVPAREFYLGPYMTVLEPDELVTGITYPDWGEGHVVLFNELAQRPGDFALTGFVGTLALDGGKITRAGLAWMAMGPTPVAMTEAEAVLAGQTLDGIDIAALSDLALRPTAPFDDQHASAEYRRTVGKRLFEKTLRAALQVKEVA